MLDVGAGFAGGAVWGVGQGPHSHDMLARIDPDTYTPLALAAEHGPLRVEPVRRRPAASLLLPDESEARACRRREQRATSSTSAWSRSSSSSRASADGSIRPWDPHGVDTLRQAVLRLPLDGAGDGLSAGADDVAQQLWAGASTRPITKTPTRSSRSISTTPTR